MIFRGNIAKKTQKSLCVLRLVAVWGRFWVSSREFLSFQPLAYTLFFRTEITESHRNVPLAIALRVPFCTSALGVADSESYATR